jgi:hypothetical protein
VVWVASRTVSLDTVPQCVLPLRCTGAAGEKSRSLWKYTVVISFLVLAQIEPPVAMLCWGVVSFLV